MQLRGWHIFKQGKWRELLLVALIAKLRGAMGAAGPGPAEGTSGEAIYFVRWWHRRQPRGGGLVGVLAGGSFVSMVGRQQVKLSEPLDFPLGLEDAG